MSGSSSKHTLVLPDRAHLSSASALSLVVDRAGVHACVSACVSTRERASARASERACVRTCVRAFEVLGHLYVTKMS